MTATMKHYARS